MSSGLQTRVLVSCPPPPSHSLLISPSSCFSSCFFFLDLFLLSTFISHLSPYPVPSLVCFLTSHTRRWGREVKKQTRPPAPTGRRPRPESDSAVVSADESGSPPASVQALTG